MAPKIWTTNYPTSLDTTTEQPVVINGTDSVDVSHLNTLSSILRTLETKVGSNLLETGGLWNVFGLAKQRPVKLTWSSATLINITAWPGESSTVPIRLQDGTWRSFTGTLTFNPATTAEGGLDTGVEADAWYYLYLVPTVADDSLLCVRGSTTSPATGGPTGYTNYRYIGAVKNLSSNLLAFDHYYPDLFSWRQFYNEFNNTSWTAILQLTLAYVPYTASATELRLYIRGKVGNPWGHFMVWADDSGTRTAGDSVNCALGVSLSDDTSNPQTNRGWVVLNVPQSIYYQKWQGSGTLAGSSLSVCGWQDKYLV